MRPVELNVGGTPNGKGRTWAYPNGKSLGVFEMPTYALSVSGTNALGHPVRQEFTVFRFGVQCKDGVNANVVGLADYQTHIIKAWVPTYRVHSERSKENGAWQVYGNFLIHDGPDTDLELFASIGCLEVFGVQGFIKFNDLILSLAGSTRPARDQQLTEIGQSGRLKITYQSATRPPLKAWR